MQASHVVEIQTVADSGPLSIRARQVCSSFDVPPDTRATPSWRFEFPFDAESWSVGLVVGPSGSGKSTVLKHVWGMPKPLQWSARSVVDDFDAALSVADITKACSAVGFNTIPAWLRPFSVLSNGEQFRVELARRILEGTGTIVVDEFTSVVDRQVARVGSHAVQKYVRASGKQFVAVTCHYDVLDWLQPDWVLDMSTQSFTRRLLQRRPPVDVVVGPIPHAAWSLFKAHHYMSADLHCGARCFGLWANGTLAAFAGIMHQPHPRVRDIVRVSRLVTLPDWQGLGLAMVLCDALGASYRSAGKRLRMYPAHPSLTRSFQRSKTWVQKKDAGDIRPPSRTSTVAMGVRPCAVFEYCGGREAPELVSR